MQIHPNRRRFMSWAASLAAAGAALPLASRAQAQGGEVRVLVGGGDWGKANIEAYCAPFEAETGIRVVPVTDTLELTQLELMGSTGNVTVDVANVHQGIINAAGARGLLEEIDYSLYTPDNLEGLTDFAKHTHGVSSLIYSYVMVYNLEAFPAGAPRPTSWSEFWDVEKFPGVRLLQSGAYGSEGPWEEALLADGVAPADIYPMDIDRVFASLDRIKPHIRRWWTTGSEIQQMMNDGVAGIVNAYDGRASILLEEGRPIEINRNQAKLNWDFWAIPKGSPNAEAAQRFIEFATRAENQAVFAQLIPYGPSNLHAFRMIPDEVGSKLASYPEYIEKSIPMNAAWYGEAGADGLTNAERLAQRWNEWVLL